MVERLKAIISSMDEVDIPVLSQDKVSRLYHLALVLTEEVFRFDKDSPLGFFARGALRGLVDDPCHDPQEPLVGEIEGTPWALRPPEERGRLCQPD